MLTEKPKWLPHADCSDMSLFCFAFTPSRTHSCGGSFFHIHIPILLAERAAIERLPETYHPLLALRTVLQGNMRVVDFLEAYSNGWLDDLMHKI